MSNVYRGTTGEFHDFVIERKGKYTHNLNFLDKTPQYRALVKKVRIDEVVESEGEFRTKNPDEAKIEHKNFQSVIAVAEVTKKVKISDIEVMEGPYLGQTFTVTDNDCLNQ